ELDNGHYLLAFKDNVTGTDGTFDPGANTVGMTMEGAGAAGLKLSTFFFEELQEQGILTHYVSSDLDEKTMTVKPAEPYGEGLEVTCGTGLEGMWLYLAFGSFLKRFGIYGSEGDPVYAFVEVTLKDDDC